MKTFSVTMRYADGDNVVEVEADDYQLDEETGGKWIEFVKDVDEEHDIVVAMFNAHDVVSVVTK